MSALDSLLVVCLCLCRLQRQKVAEHYGVVSLTFTYPTHLICMQNVWHHPAVPEAYCRWAVVGWGWRRRRFWKDCRLRRLHHREVLRQGWGLSTQHLLSILRPRRVRTRALPALRVDLDPALAHSDKIPLVPVHVQTQANVSMRHLDV